MKILVIDVGGSHVKCVATGHKRPVEFRSDSKLTPDYLLVRSPSVADASVERKHESCRPNPPTRVRSHLGEARSRHDPLPRDHF